MEIEVVGSEKVSRRAPLAPLAQPRSNPPFSMIALDVAEAGGPSIDVAGYLIISEPMGKTRSEPQASANPDFEEIFRPELEIARLSTSPAHYRTASVLSSLGKTSTSPYGFRWACMSDLRT